MAFKCIFLCLSAFPSCRTLGQHGGVHMHDPKRYAWWSVLQSCAGPASGPLLIGPASKLPYQEQIYPVPLSLHLQNVRSLYVFQSIFLEKISLGNTHWDFPKLWFLAFSLVIKAGNENIKAMEPKTPKKHKNDFSAIPDIIKFPHQLLIFI